MSVSSAETELLYKLGEAARIEIRPEEFDGLLDGLRELRACFALLEGEVPEKSAENNSPETPDNGAADFPPVRFEPLYIKKLRRQLDSGDISSCELKKLCLDRITQKDPEINAFLCTGTSEGSERSEKFGSANDSLLSGIPFAVKDNICADGFPMTCGSAFLKGFDPGYDAEAVTELKKAGAQLIGKTNLDEFAMGSSGELSAYGRVANPVSPGRMTGGSSAGSAAAVAAGMCSFALGSDTGGSVRLPASFCGVSGLKPTYGRISRYGLTAFSSSTDCIGILANTAEELSQILEFVSGDAQASGDSSRKRFAGGNSGKYSHSREFACAAEELRGMKLAVPERLLSRSGLSEEMQKAFENALKILERAGFSIENVETGDADRQLAAYSVITSGEASSNLARFDGLRYGFRAGNLRISGSGREVRDAASSDSEGGLEDYGTFFTRNRTLGFGPEVKRRILFGTYVLSEGQRFKAYGSAIRLREELIAGRRELFKNYAAIVTPAALSAAYPAHSLTPEMMHKQDMLTVGASLAGTPAVSVPMEASLNGLPQGLQLECGWMNEGLMLGIAAAFEKGMRGQ